jgi:hypothetical protein
MAARWFILKPKSLIWVNFGGPYWTMWIYFMAIWNSLQTFEIFYGHLVHYVLIWYNFFSFGVMHQETSGNPASHLRVAISVTHGNTLTCTKYIVFAIGGDIF